MSSLSKTLTFKRINKRTDDGSGAEQLRAATHFHRSNTVPRERSSFPIKDRIQVVIDLHSDSWAESCRQAQRSEEQGTYNGAGLSAVVRADGNNNIRVAAAI
jgi:predicted ATPase with chaperone activity